MHCVDSKYQCGCLNIANAPESQHSSDSQGVVSKDQLQRVIHFKFNGMRCHAETRYFLHF